MNPYTKLITWLKNETDFDLSKVNNKSKELFKLCLINGKYEFIVLFDDKVWDKETIDLYFQNKPDGLMPIYLSVYDKELCEYYVTKLLNLGFHSLVISKYSNYKNDEIYQLFLNTLKISDLDYYSLKNSYGWTSYDLIKTLISNGQFELVGAILNERNWNDECFELLSGHMVDLYGVVSFFSTYLPDFLFNYDSGKLLAELIEANVFEFITNLRGTRYNKLFFSNEKHVELVIRKYKDFPFDKYPLYYYNIDFLFERADFLKTVLEVNNSQYIKSFISYFNPSCWTMENQLLYYKLIEDGYDYPTNKVPYALYREAYKNNLRSYWRNVVYDNTISNDVLKDNDIIYSMGEAVSKGVFFNNLAFEQFCLLVFNTKSNKILNLMKFLIGMNIDNVNKLFDENGITDYLFSYLAFDPDYILYCINNGIDLVNKMNSASYATYVKFLTKYPNMSQYLLVDKNSVNKFFESGQVTMSFVDTMFSVTNYSLLLTMYDNNEQLELSEIQEYILLKTKEISNVKVKELFMEFCIDNVTGLSKKDVDNVAVLIKKIEYSNSVQIRKKSSAIVKEILKHSNPEQKLRELEDIYNEDNIPEFGKRFFVYKLLYSHDKRLDNDSSPILLNSSDEDIDKIILFDLFKISLGSFNEDLLLYLDEIKNEDSLFNDLKFSRRNVNDLSSEELLKLKKLSKKLQFFATQVFKLKYEVFEDDYKTLLSIENAIKEMINYPKTFPLFSLTDIIIKELFGKFGFNSCIHLHMYAYKCLTIKTAIEEGRHLHQKELVIKDGDLIKGVNSKYLDNILQYGSLCKELLGEDADRDVTHLDTDMSIIRGNGLSIKDVLSSNIDAKSYGDVKLLLSREDISSISPIVETRNQDGLIPYNPEDVQKTELFQVRKNSTHYAIRSGFPTTLIRAIISDKDIKRIKFLIVKKGFFIPVYNSKGDLLFSYEEYLELSKQKQGLSHYYEGSKYEISNNLESQCIIQELEGLGNNVSDANTKREAIFKQLMPVFKKYFKGVKYELDGSVTNGIIEIFDTGSTGRGTNIANDSDFDFVLRVDREFKLNTPLFNSFISDIYRAFGSSSSTSPVRLTDAKVEGIDELLKIDINPIVKTNKITYATVDCVKDRLETIKRLHPEKYSLVVANIVYAKKLLKAAGAYKSRKVRNPQGGLGGVGVETWILQHGGSLYDAAVSFLEVADRVNSFSEFKEAYSVFDFGKDHMSEEWNNFPYDDFVDNMDSNGYTRMRMALREYVNSLNQDFGSVGLK